MAKPNRNRRVTVMGALIAHVAANKSDPFAAKRAAVYLATHPGEKHAVAETADRLNAANAARAKRNERADWLSATQFQALHSLRSGLVDALKKRAPRQRQAGVRTGRTLARAA